MQTRQEVIDFCMTLPGVYEDYPFHDDNWTVMRHRHSKKMFAAICERGGVIWVNVKCAPELTFFWRSAFSAVVPAYHMNKTHWNSMILDGTISQEDIKTMLTDSYHLTFGRRPKKEKNTD